MATDHKPAQADRAPTIRTQAQFEDYLRRHEESSHPTPLDQLSAGARVRFLLSLDWGSKGLAGFDPTDLVDELTQAQIRRLLMLFGADIVEYAPRSRVSAEATRTATATTVEIGGLERRYNLFYRAARDDVRLEDAKRGNALSEHLAALLPEVRDPAVLPNLDDHDLRLLWRGASEVAYWSTDAERLDEVVGIFDELERRSLAREDDVRRTRDFLLVRRRFDAAHRFSQAHPDVGLAPLPAFNERPDADAIGPTVWRLDDEGKVLIRFAIDLAPTQILVTAGCHFSVDAAEDISADPVLGPVFARHAHWLVNMPGRESIDAAHAWNLRLPDAQVEMIHDRGEWSIFPEWSMPKFHIVRDGKIVDTVTGWPRSPASNRQLLIDALRRAGLLVGQSENLAPVTPR